MEDAAKEKTGTPSEPKPDLIIRTMQSDISSLKQSGGVAVVGQSMNMAGAASGAEKIGAENEGSGSAQEFSQEQQLYSNFKAASSEKSKGGLKTILIALFVIAIMGGLGFLVYAIALRFFSK